MQVRAEPDELVIRTLKTIQRALEETSGILGLGRVVADGDETDAEYVRGVVSRDCGKLAADAATLLASLEAIARPRAEGERLGGWFTTHTGVQFYPLDPRPEEIRSEDIAWSLAWKVRWQCHGRHALTVGEHTLRVVRVAVALAHDDGRADLEPLIRVYAPIHDADEAYLPDVARPLKPYILGWPEIRGAIEAATLQHYGLAPMPPEVAEYVHRADRLMLAVESLPLFGEDSPAHRAGKRIAREAGVVLTLRVIDAANAPIFPGQMRLDEDTEPTCEAYPMRVAPPAHVELALLAMLKALEAPKPEPPEPSGKRGWLAEAAAVPALDASTCILCGTVLPPGTDGGVCPDEDACLHRSRRVL